ncbi:MAG: S26 family signal peptidase [Thermoplasmataceae archaeon]
MKKSDKIWITITAVILVTLIGVTVYSGVWPPVSVVESSSMQHSSYWTPNGVYTGDIVFIKKVTSPTNQIVTYLDGSETGYSTYGEYGSVILYRSTNGNTIIHRAMFYLTWNGNSPVVEGYTNQSWITVTQNYVRLDNVGYSHRNLVVEISGMVGESGYITVGDYNLGSATRSEFNGALNGYIVADQNVGITSEPVKYSQIMGVAFGEIPWFGLIKLNFLRAYGEWQYYNDVPQNSYLYLGISIAVIIAAIGIPVGYLEWKKRRNWKH